MDAFLIFARLSEDETALLTLFNEIRDYVHCSHRAGSCRIYGRCAKEEFVTVCTMIVERLDVHASRTFVNIIMEYCSTASNIWCAVASHIREYAGDITRDHDELKAQVDRVCDNSRFVEHLSSIRRSGPSRSYHYVDDSVSLMHAFYVPVAIGQPLPIQSIMRLGRFVLCFVDSRAKPDAFIHPNDFNARGFTTPIWDYVVNTLPDRCSFTGSRAQPTTLVFLPGIMNLTLTEAQKAKILRTLDSDKKFFDAMYTRDAPRFFFQRFGLDGSCMNDVNTLLLGKIDNVISVLEMQWRKDHQEADDFFLPTLLLRMYFRSEIDCAPGAVHPVADWFNTTQKEHCQLCFLWKHHITHVTLIDTRMHDYCEDACVRKARILDHGGCSGFKDPILRSQELFSRVGEHWIALTCYTAKQAVITTLTSICKYLRCDGLDNSDAYNIALTCIGRTYLHWLPSDSDAHALFRALAFVMMHKVFETNYSLLSWCDLGQFLDAMFSPLVETPHVSAKMISTLARASIYACRKSEMIRMTLLSHEDQVYVRPVSPTSAPQDVDGFIGGGNVPMRFASIHAQDLFGNAAATYRQ
uniref:Non-structural protein NS1 n=1 Tax=Kammavanpettai virus TaxID=2282480 RepID=A0A3G1RP40_9REOV|nr:tubule protein [Kammavanpettai virus]